MDDEKRNVIKNHFRSVILRGRDLWKISMAENCGDKELADRFRKEYDFKYYREEGTPV